MGAYDAIETRLREEREQVVHQLSELGAGESGELRDDLDFGEGFADAAAATAERTEVLGLVESLKRSLDEIDQALARIEDGTYGTCANCGKDIGSARLEFRPSSIHCVDCKAAKAL
ncbi:MAG TPA: TraR/DksA C4-type zinc finger protein [Acidimicrobiia bacterium]|nr:TraR/DksA C4-type zinc finger protein [Acidimicrobiia bacterium]